MDNEAGKSRIRDDDIASASEDKYWQFAFACKFKRRQDIRFGFGTREKTSSPSYVQRSERGQRNVLFYLQRDLQFNDAVK
jgi:hypothetical protein